jgi:hypothetical protein
MRMPRVLFVGTLAVVASGLAWCLLLALAGR